MRAAIIALFLTVANLVVAQDVLYVIGSITDKSSGKPVPAAHVSLVTSRIGAVSDENGDYVLKIVPQKKMSIKVSHIRYAFVDQLIERPQNSDTLYLDFALSIEPRLISPVQITAHSVPDTIYGSFNYCVADFEFYNDKFLLLIYARKAQKDCSIMLRDKKGNLLLSTKVPGNAKALYKDYDGRNYVICEEQVFRIKIESALLLLIPMSTAYFNANIKPGIDRIGEKILFSDFSWNHPEFSYYTVWRYDTLIENLKTISNKPLMRMYRFEYYYLNNAQRVAAWKLAGQYEGLDQHDVAALMTGFQHSFYYESLYAPLFVVDDTVLIFDHYANKLYRYDQSNRVVDSVEIEYHKSHGSMKWKKELVKDIGNDDIYAVFQKNGYYYLNYIDTKQGKLNGAFKMSDKYTEKMKIKDDYVYYVYDPQDRFQTPFLYREQIRL